MKELDDDGSSGISCCGDLPRSLFSGFSYHSCFSSRGKPGEAAASKASVVGRPHSQAEENVVIRRSGLEFDEREEAAERLNAEKTLGNGITKPIPRRRRNLKVTYIEPKTVLHMIIFFSRPLFGA